MAFSSNQAVIFLFHLGLCQLTANSEDPKLLRLQLTSQPCQEMKLEQCHLSPPVMINAYTYRWVGHACENSQLCMESILLKLTVISG